MPTWDEYQQASGGRETTDQGVSRLTGDKAGIRDEVWENKGFEGQDGTTRWRHGGFQQGPVAQYNRDLAARRAQQNARMDQRLQGVLGVDSSAEIAQQQALNANLAQMRPGSIGGMWAMRPGMSGTMRAGVDARANEDRNNLALMAQHGRMRSRGYLMDQDMVNQMMGAGAKMDDAMGRDAMARQQQNFNNTMQDVNTAMQGMGSAWAMGGNMARG